MQREPGGKAQIISAIVALITYAITKYLKLLPEEVDLLAPLIAYAVTQVMTWVWARTKTTPVDDPRLPEGTAVTLPDGTAGTVVTK